MRLDRIVTLCVARPLRAAGIGASKRALPILMYHGISDDPQPEFSPYYKTTTSRAVFEQHLRRLTEGGYRSVTMDEAASILQAGDARMDKTVVITFDDGFRDFYDLAFPALKQHGHTAVMYLPTAFIGNDRRSFKGRGCLTWQEVRELRAAGIEFGSHTVSHPKLYELSWQEIEIELAVSKERIERELDEEAASFAYPFAFPQQDERFADKFKKMLRDLGYRNCATTIIGRARAGDDLFCLKRLPANVCDDRALLDAKLTGAYDWLALPQSWSKKAKGWLRRAPAARPALDVAPNPSNGR
jgi:peptidoglycan/xylan/chitin deacetylase (PgdA/CDA1 family)